MATWFTSDPHYGHCRILDFCPRTRPFKDPAEMDLQLVTSWKSLVKPGDDVWVLGDLSWYYPKKTAKIFADLPGNKHLILGNHDFDAGFDVSFDVLGCFSWVGERTSINIDGIKIVLDHYPILEWHHAHRGAFHFHGHTHGNVVHPGRALDVGIDGPLGTGDCRPYSWYECKAYCEGRPLPK
jgi:calcineurin-like phosphoesterase family protein